jgi:hypothetical protein
MKKLFSLLFLLIFAISVNAASIKTPVNQQTAATGTFTTLSSTTFDATTGTIDTLGGAMDCNNENITNIDVDSGALDGVTIGGASAGAGTFTTGTITTANVSTLMNLSPQSSTPNGAVTGNVFCQESDGIIYGYDGSAWNALW